MRNLLVTFLFLACSFAFAMAQTADPLLSKTFKAYQSLLGFRVRSTIVAEQKVGEMAMKRTIKHEAVYQRPNLLFVRWVEEGEKGRVTIVSDGKNLFTQVDALKQVKKENAPKTLKEIVRSGGGTSPVVDDLSCFIGEGWKDKVAGAKVIGKESLNKLATTKIQLNLKGGDTQTLWVDEKGFIWKSQRRIEQKHPQGNIVVTITETWQEISANPKLPKEFFTYKRPSGFKEVREFQVPQMGPPQKR
jgi:outer membrane lipoprotein-sorting protein